MEIGRINSAIHATELIATGAGPAALRIANQSSPVALIADRGENGVIGKGTAAGVRGIARPVGTLGFGGAGPASGGIGVLGSSSSPSGEGVRGEASGTGVVGFSLSRSPNTDGGVWGIGLQPDGNGVIGEANSGQLAYGVWGKSSTGFAGAFDGKVTVNGELTKSSGGFKIDHPLDPENKYLLHSFVESPDALNVYSGNTTTDEDGNAVVALPDYFEALNQDFRYQLTVLGQFAQAVVAEELTANRFVIKTDLANVKVSWQVSGVRKDAYASSYPMAVEEEKAEEARGTYLHPEAFGQSEERAEGYAREQALRSRMAEMLEAHPLETDVGGLDQAG